MLKPIEVTPRLAKLREKMAAHNYDALLVVNESNVTYLSGYTNHDSFLFITGNAHGAANIFITDFRYTEQAAAECPDYESVLHRGTAPLLPVRISELCAKYGIKNLAFEYNHIGYARHQEIQQALTGVEMVASKGLVEELRYIKDEAEGQRLRLACEATDRVFAAVCKFIRPGVTERQVEWEVIRNIREQGCDLSFNPIVVSGIRGSLPHGVANDKVVEKGEFITLDFGCLYEGYHADMTRTVFVGEPTAEQRQMYDTVLKAILAAEAFIKDGVTGAATDKVARDLIYQAGYEGRFGHGLGHGVGLDVHENPFMGEVHDFTLQAGNYLTVEPGIYIPGVGGVRIEDVVAVTKDGCDILYSSTKELICL
jgi:Xaa-Pro aminopeptidase